MLDIKKKKKTVTKLKNAFDGHVSRLDMTKGIISELEDWSTEILIKMQR